MSEPTSIEKIKAYHSIKKYLNEDQQNELIKILQLKPVDIEKRLWGKDNEIEFILMIYLLQQCKNIFGFDEGIAKLTNTVISDIFVELKDGTKLVVEIKSTTEKRYSISEKLLNEKEKFADNFNAKLYFAIKVSGYWMLFSSDYLKAHNRKILVEKDMLNSEFNKIFGDRTFMFPKGLSIKTTYSKTGKNMGVYNEKYGGLIKYEITYNGRKFIKISSQENKLFFLTFLFQRLQDAMSNYSQEIIVIDNNKTMIIGTLTNEAIMMNLSEFILSPIEHIVSSLGQTYDFNQYLSLLIDKRDTFGEREHFLFGIDFLVSNGYPILEKKGQYLYPYNV